MTNGGRWYQRHSLPALDALYEQQKFMADPEARQKVIWDMDAMAMNDAAYLVLMWPEFYPRALEFCEGLDPDVESVEHEHADGHRLVGSPGVAALPIVEE